MFDATLKSLTRGEVLPSKTLTNKNAKVGINKIYLPSWRAFMQTLTLQRSMNESFQQAAYFDQLANLGKDPLCHGEKNYPVSAVVWINHTFIVQFGEKCEGR